MHVFNNADDDGRCLLGETSNLCYDLTGVVSTSMKREAFERKYSRREL